MKLRSPSLWIATLSAGAVIAFVVSDIGQRPSPGPLAEVHGREENLSGKRDCSECHGGWRESMTESCLACHTEIQEDIDKPHGLHGVIGKGKAMECAPCHSEHHGVDFLMVNDQSFAAADVPDVQKFDHRSIGWEMAGKHLELACEKCHTHAEDAVLPKGERRYLALEQDCKSCHKDPHLGRMALACDKCHVQDDFKKIAYGDHDKYLPLIGGHAGVSCRECHAEKDAHALEALGREKEPPARECIECHASPHDRRFVAGVAAMVSKTPGSECVECHKPEHVTFYDPSIEVTREQHQLSRFKLDPPHDKGACEDCHSLKAKTFAQRFPGRGNDDCARCHADPHAGQFNIGPFAVRRCTDCHELTKWEPHTFTKERHAKTDFALVGKHAETDCNKCHKTFDEGAARSFHGTPSDCEGCHRDSHDGFFEKFTKTALRPKAGSCAMCHNSTNFSALPKKGFDHARWTGYALLGAHAQSECESCHPRSRAPDRSGRTFGRVAQCFGKLTGCETCHKDVHAGVFDAPNRSRQVAGRTGCARCHDESSFRTVSIDFDHGKWTGFQLDGAHADCGCNDCHAPLKEPDENGRTFARSKGAACSDCHEDNHAGQFAKGGKTDCQRCHRSATDFSDVFFKHNLHSRYRLDETHAEVACAGCHKPEKQGGREFIRYRPLGMECGDCHGAPQDLLRRRKEKHE